MKPTSSASTTSSTVSRTDTLSGPGTSPRVRREYARRRAATASTGVALRCGSGFSGPLWRVDQAVCIGPARDETGSSSPSHARHVERATIPDPTASVRHGRDHRSSDADRDRSEDFVWPGRHHQSRRHDRRMQTAIKERHHQQARLAYRCGCPRLSTPCPIRARPPARMTARARQCSSRSSPGRRGDRRTDTA